MADAREPLTYVLPLRWREPGPIEDLADYLSGVAAAADEVIVVDGSLPDRFAEHATRLPDTVTHIRPDPDLDYVNGKVNGVVTGVRRARNERVVIADDDVRYGIDELLRTGRLLARGDLVRPQNHFDEWPWHAVWDGPRSLLNRVATGDPEFPRGDFPGTLAVRRSRFVEANAYDGDALFENLELMRTIRAAGGTVLTPLDLFVPRKPPTARHFLSQRVRQAYDDFTLPFRAAAFMAIVPVTVALPGRFRGRWLLTLAAVTAVTAEAGRRTAGADRHFPFRVSLCAPLWTAERALCSWLAVGSFLRGGAKYGDARIRLAANPTRRLRRRLRPARVGRPSPPPTGS